MCYERKMCKVFCFCLLFFFCLFFLCFQRIFCLFWSFLFCFLVFGWFSLFLLYCCVLSEASLCSTASFFAERGKQEGKNQFAKFGASGEEGKEEWIFRAAENTARNRSCCGHEAEEWFIWFFFWLLGKTPQSKFSLLC